MQTNQQSTWALNHSGKDQLQAALASVCMAIGQLENFDHDACADSDWAKDLTQRDKQDIDASLSMLYLASRNLIRTLGMPYNVDPMFVDPILPVAVHLVPRTPNEIDVAAYLEASLDHINVDVNS